MPWGSGLEDLLARRLSPLLARQVPVRSVARGPLDGVARVRWADGTVVLARSATPGALTRLTRVLASNAHVVATDLQRTGPQPSAGPDGPSVLMTLTEQGRRGARPLELLVVGLDQPD